MLGGGQLPAPRALADEVRVDAQHGDGRLQVVEDLAAEVPPRRGGAGPRLARLALVTLVAFLVRSRRAAPRPRRTRPGCLRGRPAHGLEGEEHGERPQRAQRERAGRLEGSGRVQRDEKREPRVRPDEEEPRRLARRERSAREKDEQERREVAPGPARALEREERERERDEEAQRLGERPESARGALGGRERRRRAVRRPRDPRARGRRPAARPPRQGRRGGTGTGGPGPGSLRPPRLSAGRDRPGGPPRRPALSAHTRIPPGRGRPAGGRS